jgi:flagellar biosynthesis GTPase FlhF
VSISSLHSAVARLQKDIASLRERISRETTAEGKKQGELGRLRKDLAKTRNPSQAQSKLRQIERVTSDAGRIQKIKAEFEKELGRKLDEMGRAEQRLSKEREGQNRRAKSETDRERRTQMTFNRQERTRELDHQRALTREFEEQADILRKLERNKEAKAWRMGSLFLILFMAVASVVFVFDTSVKNAWVLLISFLVIPTLLLLLVASTLRSIGDLSEKGFITLVDLALKFQLRGIPLLGKYLKGRDEQQSSGEAGPSHEDGGNDSASEQAETP